MHGDKTVSSFQKQKFSTWKSLSLLLGTRGQR